ncbi:unnamed protein product [Prorocentrum cordatum]|uniref:Prohibitin n=1 Tax=Prorocentrum cordatum TaxID=2364126 RepID=A0ABN9XNS0_9DINO|nr:unnamed protein product [Polarella glacialis]
MARFDPTKLLQGLASGSGPLLAAGLGALGGAAYLGKSTFYTVDAGHMAVKYSRLSGVGVDTYMEGLHFMVPWLERPIIFDTRARPHTMTSLTGSRDLQMVNINVRVLSKPDSGRLPEIYRLLGTDFDEKVLPSIVNEVLKSVVAQYNASQLVVQRDQVSRMIRQRLMQRAADFHILLDDVSITHLNFSPDYEKAVESKQVAQQHAERARYLVLKAQEEKKKTIIHAEGERASAQMIGSAMKENPGFIELRKIAVAKEISGLLSKSNNRMVLSSDSLLLDLAVHESSQAAQQEPKAKKRWW